MDDAGLISRGSYLTRRPVTRTRGPAAGSFHLACALWPCGLSLGPSSFGSNAGRRPPILLRIFLRAGATIKIPQRENTPHPHEHLGPLNNFANPKTARRRTGNMLWGVTRIGRGVWFKFRRTRAGAPGALRAHSLHSRRAQHCAHTNENKPQTRRKLSEKTCVTV